MAALLPVSLGVALFAATHLLLAWPPLRQPLVARLGAFGFTAFYSVVAWLTFGVAVSLYVAHAADGPPGLALGAYPVPRAVAIGAIALGAMLMVGAFADYGSSPFAIGSTRVRGPVGLERVTRHPFFVGTALLGAAHAMLATRAVGAIFMGGLGAIALLGSHFQDCKHAALRGAAYAPISRRPRCCRSRRSQRVASGSSRRSFRTLISPRDSPSRPRCARSMRSSSHMGESS
jgi:uncharacterized membrane protein